MDERLDDLFAELRQMKQQRRIGCDTQNEEIARVLQTRAAQQTRHVANHIDAADEVIQCPKDKKLGTHFWSRASWIIGRSLRLDAVAKSAFMEGILPDNLESVKALSERFRAWAENASKPETAETFTEYANQLDAIALELRNLRTKTRPVPRSYGDLSDLPLELISELAGVKVDELEDQIFNIVRSGSEVDLDALLIELYRRFQVIQTRRFLQNKTYRMAQKGLIYSVPKRKGVYTATKPEGSDEAEGAAPHDEEIEEWERIARSADAEDDDAEIPFQNRRRPEGRRKLFQCPLQTFAAPATGRHTKRKGVRHVAHGPDINIQLRAEDRSVAERSQALLYLGPSNLSPYVRKFDNGQSCRAEDALHWILRRN